MDLRVSIIDDEHELTKILESTNLDEYDLIDLLMKRASEWLPLWIQQVYMYVGAGKTFRPFKVASRFLVRVFASDDAGGRA